MGVALQDGGIISEEVWGDDGHQLFVEIATVCDSTV